MTAIDKVCIAMFAADAFKSSEIEFPLDTLRQAGAAAEVSLFEDGMWAPAQ